MARLRGPRAASPWLSVLLILIIIVVVLAFLNYYRVIDLSMWWSRVTGL